MILKISEEASQVLTALEHFVESRNTKGAGKRFISRFKKRLQEYLSKGLHLECKQTKLKQYNLCCFYINDWLIAYEVQSNKDIVIRVIIHGSLIV